MSLKATKGKFRALFSTPEGQEVLYEILLECGFGESLVALDQKAQNDKVAKYEVAVWLKEMIKEEV